MSARPRVGDEFGQQLPRAVCCARISAECRFPRAHKAKRIRGGNSEKLGEKVQNNLLRAAPSRSRRVAGSARSAPEEGSELHVCPSEGFTGPMSSARAVTHLRATKCSGNIDTKLGN